VPYFVFLEFTDPKIRNFISSLREAMTGKVDNKPAHITVRGPYDNPPELGQLEQLNDEIRGYGVVISGAGTFKTDSGFVVYLRVLSPVFKKIWWKPDYAIEKFGINPHITVYETAKQKDAKAVEKFLRGERIELSTFSSILTVNMSKQSNLFEVNIDPALQKQRAHLFEKWNVRPGIMQRASLLHDLLENQAR
jgi:hypothetical protein